MAVRVVATPDAALAKRAHRGGDVGVALFHSGGHDLPGLGGSLRARVTKGLPNPPTSLAWDFLSVALAVFAADRFVLRSEAEDGWTRVVSLEIAVHNPLIWQGQAKQLAAVLRFLTGDIWHLTFTGGGSRPPNFKPRDTDRDTVCLFSGGLDSLLGAIKLLAEGRKPFLISQGSQKEISPQKYLAHKLGLEDQRFEGRVSERWQPPYEGSTRARSIIFFAYGVVAASSLGLNKVIVPENGLIAINPPLTPRRLGSLSTRTTHPHFLSSLQAVLHDVGIGVELKNIFEGKSKGEMLAECAHPQISRLAANSYSCGKGKRKNGQCGVCVPCLIRRASFRTAKIGDPPSRYFSDLSAARTYDDVMSMRMAVARHRNQSSVDFERWVATAGPLPADSTRRAAILHSVAAGIQEVGDFLARVRWSN